MSRVKALKINYMITDLPYRLSEFRHRANLSQAEVADAIGCTRQYISEIENGKAVPGYEILVRFLATTKPSDEHLIRLVKGWDE